MTSSRDDVGPKLPELPSPAPMQGRSLLSLSAFRLHGKRYPAPTMVDIIVDDRVIELIHFLFFLLYLLLSYILCMCR